MTNNGNKKSDTGTADTTPGGSQPPGGKPGETQAGAADRGMTTTTTVIGGSGSAKSRTSLPNTLVARTLGNITFRKSKNGTYQTSRGAILGTDQQAKNALERLKHNVPGLPKGSYFQLNSDRSVTIIPGGQ